MNKPYPLVISLHGGGGSYKIFTNIWKHFENPQFIMATPQAPYKWLMGDEIGYDWSAWPTGDIRVMANALELMSEYLRNLILTLTGKYDINEIYILGFSQGSIITMIAGIDNHDLINGMIILSGPALFLPGRSPWIDSFELEWPSEESVRAAHNSRIFLAHGRSDQRIHIGRAHESVDKFEEFGYTVTLFEFEGGHEINKEAMRRIENWILEDK